jgi:hypothetical protein
LWNITNTGSSIENLALRAGEARAIDLIARRGTGGIACTIEKIGIACTI